jgi:hypothetical protein
MAADKVHGHRGGDLAGSRRSRTWSLAGGERARGGGRLLGQGVLGDVMSDADVPASLKLAEWTGRPNVGWNGWK